MSDTKSIASEDSFKSAAAEASQEERFSPEEEKVRVPYGFACNEAHSMTGSA
jgi:hypothetical protein